MSSSPSNFPQVPPPLPPPAPPPAQRSSSSGKRIAIGFIAFVVVASAAALVISHHNDSERSARNAGNAALYQDYLAGKLPASAYQTTTTTTDANGNVSTVTEDAPAGNANGYGQAMQDEAVLPSPNSPAGAMQRVSLADPSAGFPNALSLSIPAGWRFQGEVVRNVPCSPGDPFPQLQATSPDGQSSLTIMTPFFTASQRVDFDMSSCGTVAPLTSTAEILSRYVVPAIRRGAQASAAEALPGGANLVQAAMISGMLPGGQNDGGGNISGDSARVRVSSTQNGTPVEEYIVGLTAIQRRPGMAGGISTTLVEIFRAPAGKLDSFYAEVATNLRPTPNPQWQQRSADLARQETWQSQQRGNRQRAQILQNGDAAGAAGRAMLAQTRNNIRATGQASMDAAARSEAARHSGAVGMANHVGDRATQTYFFCNGTGYTTNNNPNPPGPGWYPCH